ncbi:MAG: glycoside hydrolase family 16 protein [Tannerellaceae bacterium]|jgi:hypothetical protein|nr:glycoside hydrolase family 16 protein [Tannerellaceae bacterium]
MNKTFFLVFLAVVLMASYVQAQQTGAASEARYHGPFIENFNKSASEFFNFNMRRIGYDYRYYPNIPSLTERGTDIMMLRMDTEDPAGAGRGPEIGSKELTHFGTYSARIRVPDVTKVQPNLGAVVGYFTYRMDSVHGLSEIDYEWLIADPEVIYIGTWTGTKGDLQRVGRTINLAKGIIYSTSYKADRAERNRSGQLTGLQSQPETITPIANYNAAARFYIYGFDWYPNRLTWWIIHPDTNEKIVLWDYPGPTPNFTGIPVPPTRYLINFWHTNNWPVQTNPNSIEKPLYPYALEVDWMSYTPFEDLNKAYQVQNQ